MPKKTKKEKIIAEYRRKLQSVGQRLAGPALTHKPTIMSPAPQGQSSQPNYQLEPLKQLYEKPRTNLSLYSGDLVAIQHDLTKTIALAAVTIVVEFLLYWQIGR